MQDHPTLNTAAFSKPRSFFTCVRVLTQREKFQKLNLNIYHKDFPQISVRMESYGKDFFCIWKLYDEKFWSTRVFWLVLTHKSTYIGSFWQKNQQVSANNFRVFRTSFSGLCRLEKAVGLTPNAKPRQKVLTIRTSSALQLEKITPSISKANPGGFLAMS